MTTEDEASPKNPIPPTIYHRDIVDTHSDETTRLLKLGLDEHRGPIVDLLGELRKQSEENLNRLLAAATDQSLADLEGLLIEGTGSLEALRTLKDDAVDQVKNPRSPEYVYFGSIAIYYFAIAACLKQFGEKITKQSPEILADSLLDLAATVGEPWQSLLIQATQRIQSN